MSAEVQIVNLEVTRGSSFGIRVETLDDSLTPIDLTGYGVRGVVKNKYSDSEILVNLSPVIYDATAGLIDITLTPAETILFPITEALYDVERYSLSTTEATKILKGKFSVHPEVTSEDSYP